MRGPDPSERADPGCQDPVLVRFGRRVPVTFEVDRMGADVDEVLRERWPGYPEADGEGHEHESHGRIITVRVDPRKRT